MTDIATLTAILCAAHYQRRAPETDADRHRTIAAAYEDAKLILAMLPDSDVATPEQPPPSPGTIGRSAGAKASRRRTANGRWTATGS
jgi:hypothetical protein